MKDVKEVLDKVEKGELTSKEGADILRSLPYKNRDVKYARKIKIKIHLKEENRKINLPAIPIWLVEKLVLIAVLFFQYFPGKRDSNRIKEKEKVEVKLKDKEINLLKDVQTEIHIEDLKILFSNLKYIPPCRLVEVNDGNFVEIYMI